MPIAVLSHPCRRWRLLGCAALALTLAACASGSAERRPYLINEALDRADKHLSRGQTWEAAEMFRVVQLADPISARALQGLAAAGHTTQTTTLPTWLGINRSPVAPDASLPLAIALYPINRLLDLADVVSFHVGLEGGALLDVHATRAVQVGLGGGGGVELGWWQKRDLGLSVGHLGEFALLPISASNEGFARFGTGGIRTNSTTLLGINAPSDRAFQIHNDYWGVGCQAMLALIGIGIEIHPLEIADVLGGFFLIDFLHDDPGQTRALKLDSNDQAVMQSLLDSLSSTEMSDNLKKISNQP